MVTWPWVRAARPTELNALVRGQAWASAPLPGQAAGARSVGVH